MEDTTDTVTPDVSPPRRQPWDAAGLLALVNGVLVGVVGVYLATTSTTITIIASAAAVASACIVLILHRVTP